MVTIAYSTSLPLKFLLITTTKQKRIGYPPPTKKLHTFFRVQVMVHSMFSFIQLTFMEHQLCAKLCPENFPGSTILRGYHTYRVTYQDKTGGGENVNFFSKLHILHIGSVL